MDKIKEFHRKISVYLPKQKHILFLVFYPKFEKEIKQEIEKIEKNELIEVKIKIISPSLGALNEEKEAQDPKFLKKLYIALLKVLMRKYKTAEKVWEEIQEWKKKSIFHFV